VRYFRLNIEAQRTQIHSKTVKPITIDVHSKKHARTLNQKM